MSDRPARRVVSSTWSLLVMAMVVTLAGCATKASVGVPSPGVRDEVRALNDGMEASFRAGDLRAVASYYADDGILLSSHGNRTEGREAIDAYWARFTNPLDWELTVDELSGTDDLVCQRGRSTITRVRDGEPYDSVVSFLLIWVRQADGALRIAVDGYW